MGKSLILFSLLVTGYVVEAELIRRNLEAASAVVKRGIGLGMGAGLGAAVGAGLGAGLGAGMGALGYEVPTAGPQLASLVAMFGGDFAAKK
ncbi:hypothetical protein Zmor_002153 [Zophobas morio]|uniref:Uncharacterized protein n=1 Tax=Zophobas morio TaxID=2755281 RepID=A0AA38J0H9_9CUCU|nr:hypothetical protein Zmor_002153 [Zophobas morio]